MKRDWPIDGDRREWLVRRNCSLTPRQTVAVWAALLALSLGVGLFFTLQGAWYVLVFSVLEMTAVTAAFIVYSRHATDCDRIVHEHDMLFVEKVRGGRASTIQLDPCWVRIEAPQRRRDPIRLVARGVTVDVGTWLPEEARRALARELREQLAQ
ncbi:DUF2244 domain-containing protein [Pseudoduganella sp. SL102]|uniref:DUF2244 domain-containing protein n=1 Tax=Pseudoduganella sp. SL102 TaxID=2995154 RepID=UPI00248CB719|nr:DUF2244 domain-containing protein [Pseudoduganella sp. SL102]WBS02766.1 DUF2244 domain-containing protein [Pseudoduganella sp. SL102]